MVKLRLNNLTGKPVRLEHAEIPEGMDASVDLLEEDQRLYLQIRAGSFPSDDGADSRVIRATLAGSSASETVRILLIGK